MITNDKELIQAMKTVRLSESARARMREQLSAYADLHSMPSQAGGSFQILPFMMMALTRSRPVLAGVLMVVLIAGVGGTATFAAESAVPGDVLYPVKVGVNEPVASVFAGSGESQARFHAKLAVRRVEEAAKLDAKGKLTPEVEAHLADTFEKETARALEAADKLAAGGDMSAPLAIRAELADNPVVQEFALATPSATASADTAILAVADQTNSTDAAGDAHGAVATTMMVATEVVPTSSADASVRTMMAVEQSPAPRAKEVATTTETSQPQQTKKAQTRKAVVVQAKLPDSIRARIARTVAMIEQRTQQATSTNEGAIESVAAVQIARPQQQEGSQALLAGTSVVRSQRAKTAAQQNASTTVQTSGAEGSATASVTTEVAPAAPAFNPDLIREVGKSSNVIDAANSVLPIRLNSH